MIAAREIPLIVLAVGLYALAMAVAAESLFTTSRTISMVGLMAVILLATVNYYGDFFFDGVVDPRSKKWPKIVFCGLALLVMAIAWFSAWSQLQEYSDFLGLFLPKLAIALFLLWYGSTALFSSFFMGKEAAIFMHNPWTWLFGKRSKE